MAKRVKAIVKPEVLTWCRTSAGYSIADAAGALRLRTEQLAAWETLDSDDAPSIPQLRKLSELYKRPLAVFFLQQVPRDFQVLRDLRRLPGTGPRIYSPAVILEMRRAEQQRALALELSEDLRETPTKFNLQAELREEPAVVAERIRTALGINFATQTDWATTDGRAAFNGWRKRVESVGVLVFQATRFDFDDASGFAIFEEVMPVIVVNRKDAVTRRTFSLVHELTHLLLRVSGVSDLDAEGDRSPEDSAIEIFCNQVAANALMPAREFRSVDVVRQKGAGRWEWSDDELTAIGKTFGTSREAVLRRLLGFNLTSEDFYRATRARLLEEYAAIKARQRESRSELKRNMPQETLSNFGRPLVSMILENYYQDRLTLSDVAGYLGIKARHVSTLEQMARG